MNWDRIQGNWKQIIGKAKEQWGKLTDVQSAPYVGSGNSVEHPAVYGSHQARLTST